MMVHGSFEKFSLFSTQSIENSVILALEAPLSFDNLKISKGNSNYIS